MAIFQSKKKTQNTETPKRVSFGEIGYTGTKFFSGYISDEEYLTELNWQTGITVYDRMRKSDGQVRAILQSIILPILNARWYIECEEDNDENTKIAYELERNILSGMEIPWANTLRQILSHLVFGFSIFERVYEIKDGKVALKKLAPRIQKTLHKWNVDEYGALQSIEQYVTRPNSNTKYITIPTDRLVVFVNDMEGSNYQGVSILRSAYKHWYIKDELYKIDAIGHDRFASGVPYAKEPLGAVQGDISRVETVLSNLHSREKSWMNVPNGWDIGILEKTGSNESIIKSIQHHNEEIGKSVLAQFINLGTTQSGSRSLGESFEELFLMSINSVANNICDTLNATVIKELCEYNYKIKDGMYPKLKCGTIMLNPGEFVNALKLAKDGGMLRPDIDIENHVRELYGLQKVTEEEEAEREGESNNTEPNSGDKNNSIDATGNNSDIPAKDKTKDKKEIELHEHKLREYTRRRQLSEIETKCCDISVIEKHFSEGADRNLKAIEKIRESQIAGVARLVVSRDPADIRAPGVGDMSKALYEQMVVSYEQGKKDLRGELKAQAKQGEIKLAETLGDSDMLKAIKRKAKAESVSMGNKLINAALWHQGRVPLESTDDEAEEFIATALADVGTRDIERFAAAAANYAYGLGREETANENEDQIEYAVYSSILDDRACENCLPKDMVEHELDDPEFATPSPDCLGGEGACRCVNIYKLKGMEGDFATKSKSDYEKDKTAVDEGTLDADKMRERYELPKYTEPE